MAAPTITKCLGCAAVDTEASGPFQGGGDMSSRRGWMLALSLVCRMALAADPPAPAPGTVIRAGTRSDGSSGSAKSNQTIVIRGNRIESVGAGAVPAGA